MTLIHLALAHSADERHLTPLRAMRLNGPCLLAPQPMRPVHSNLLAAFGLWRRMHRAPLAAPVTMRAADAPLLARRAGCKTRRRAALGSLCAA